MKKSRRNREIKANHRDLPPKGPPLGKPVERVGKSGVPQGPTPKTWEWLLEGFSSPPLGETGTIVPVDVTTFGRNLA